MFMTAWLPKKQQSVFPLYNRFRYGALFKIRWRLKFVYCKVKDAHKLALFTRNQNNGCFNLQQSRIENRNTNSQTLKKNMADTWTPWRKWKRCTKSRLFLDEIYKIEIWNMESLVGRVDACCLFLIIRTRVKKKNLKLYCLNRIKNKMITSKSRLNSRRVQADWEGMMKCPNPNILIEIVVDEEF